LEKVEWSQADEDAYLHQQIERPTLQAKGDGTFANIPGEFGAKNGEAMTLDAKTYQNYEFGYAVYDASTGEHYYAGHNIDATGAKTMVGKDHWLGYVGAAFNVAKGTSDYIGNALGADFATIESDVTAALKAKYAEYFDKGYCPGVCACDVKSWDAKYCTQDFTYGDGSFSFDEDRCQMSFLMYNPESKEAHLMSDPYATYWNANETLGYPASEAGEFTLTLPNATSPSTVEAQIFSRGIIYQSGGFTQVIVGYTYNSATADFTPVASPDVPSEYGSLKKTIAINDTDKIFVYEYGSIICKLINNVYTYERRTGRIYSSATEYKKNSLTWWLSSQGVGSIEEDSSYSASEKERILTQVQSKYRSAYNTDFMIGFRESNFGYLWNDVDAQQFKLGDSTACPWEGTRTNISTICWNRNNDTFSLLKDNPLVLWDHGGNYRDWGAPLADSTTDSEGTVYQSFDGGLLVLIQGKRDLAFLFDGTMAEYNAGKAGYERPNIWNIGASSH
jgi:hypothetical protein